MNVVCFMYCTGDVELFSHTCVTPSHIVQNTGSDNTDFPSVHTLYFHES